jgi:hypothetical protein
MGMDRSSSRSRGSDRAERYKRSGRRRCSPGNHLAPGCKAASGPKAACRAPERVFGSGLNFSRRFALISRTWWRAETTMTDLSVPILALIVEDDEERREIVAET